MKKEIKIKGRIYVLKEKKRRKRTPKIEKRKTVSKKVKGPFAKEKNKIKSEEKRIGRKKAGLRLRIAKSDVMAADRAKEKLQTLGEKLQAKQIPLKKNIKPIKKKLKKLRKKQKDIKMKKAHLRNAMKKTSVHTKNMQSKVSSLEKNVRLSNKEKK